MKTPPGLNFKQILTKMQLLHEVFGEPHYGTRMCYGCESLQGQQISLVPPEPFCSTIAKFKTLLLQSRMPYAACILQYR